jgi:hypothetical protein
MIQWQYRVRTFTVDREDEIVIHHVQRTYSDLDWKDLPKYSPIALEAWLEEWGREGWELVTCEPAETIGKQGDIGSSYQTLMSWRRAFLCVFKRPVEE